VILLKVVAVGTSTLSKLFTIDGTSNIILIMGIYLKSHQSCLQILKFSGRGGGHLMLPTLGSRPSVGKIFAYIFYEMTTAGHLLFQYSPLLQSLLITLQPYWKSGDIFLFHPVA
jgi:hypothetical protein